MTCFALLHSPLVGPFTWSLVAKELQRRGWPQWRDEELANLIPNFERRQKLLAELTPQPLSFFDGSIPVFPGWPDAPCAYLQLSASYDYSAAEAKQRGWEVVRLNAGHLYMLVNETAVTNDILTLGQKVKGK